MKKRMTDGLLGELSRDVHPSKDLWPAIEQRLGERPSRRRSRLLDLPMGLRAAAAATLVLAIGLGALLIRKPASELDAASRAYLQAARDLVASVERAGGSSVESDELEMFADEVTRLATDIDASIRSLAQDNESEQAAVALFWNETDGLEYFAQIAHALGDKL